MFSRQWNIVRISGYLRCDLSPIQEIEDALCERLSGVIPADTMER